MVVQDAPPLAAAVDCVNVLDWLPVPHVFEQVLQLPQAPAQLTGHDAVLQFCDCVPAFSAPYVVVQDTPPDDAAVDCVNVLAWLPVPHVLEQVPQLPHVPTQSTAQVHQWLLQVLSQLYWLASHHEDE